MRLRRQTEHRTVAAATIAGPYEGAVVFGDGAADVGRPHAVAEREAEQVSGRGAIEFGETPSHAAEPGWGEQGPGEVQGGAKKKVGHGRAPCGEEEGGNGVLKCCVDACSHALRRRRAPDGL